MTTGVQAAPAPSPHLRLASARGRWVVLATVLGSAVVGIDATAINVATPAIGRDLDASLAGLQWTVNAYTLALAGLLLLGGSLGDRFGRRRLFVAGVVWFAVASGLCAIAPTVETLIAARALQGVGGALLTPGSLAIIQASFRPEDRGAAIGAWTGLGGVAIAIGPPLGGSLVDMASWRAIFLLNVPVAIAVIIISQGHVPETRDPVSASMDVAGALLAAVAVAGLVFGLVEGPGAGWSAGIVVSALAVGTVALVGFLLTERARTHPMLPLAIFRSVQFSGANLVTFVVYAALGGALFLLPIQLQQTAGYTALGAGLALLPMTVVMLLLSARAGRLAEEIGPRVPMTLGPLVSAAGLAWMAGVGEGSRYLTDVLPSVTVFGLGLSLTVAPLTATVLAATSDEHAGVASGVNNDVARLGGIIAVGVLPPVAGITDLDHLDGGALSDGFATAMWISASVCAAGAALAWILIRRPMSPVGHEPVPSCPLDGPPTLSAIREPAA